MAVSLKRLVLLSLLVSTQAMAQAGGVWSPPFNHKIVDDNDPGEVASPLVNPADWITNNDPANKRVNALHSCVIPVGPHRGEVLVWDGNLHGIGVRQKQPWSIVNPSWQPFGPGYRFHNGILLMPTDAQGVVLGELFCAGQCWMPDGRLLVAGGTRRYPSGSQGWGGSKLVYQWDPDDQNGLFGSTWTKQSDLYVERWYPTVLYDATDFWRAIIAGGTDSSGSAPMQPRNSYESGRINFAATPPSITYEQHATAPDVRLYLGPPTSPSLPLLFTNYPYLHVLTDGAIFNSGDNAQAFRWQHNPSAQQPAYFYDTGYFTPPTEVFLRATSVMYPNVGGVYNRIMRLGGARFGSASDAVDIALALTPGSFWLSGTSGVFKLTAKRYQGNTVILPNGQLFAVGGSNTVTGCPGATGPKPCPEVSSELLVNHQAWVPMAPPDGPRDYHACAVLLPDGRVFVSGGERRTWDYQIWSPPYLNPGQVRPLGVQVGISQSQLGGLGYAAAITYWATWSNQLPFGAVVEKIVLMRPHAQTHHDDGAQRYVELNSWPSDDDAQIRFFSGPPSRFHAPPGWYMLFLVTNQGVPSNAWWVHLQ